MDDKDLRGRLEDLFSDLSPESLEEEKEGEPSFEEALLTNLLGDQAGNEPAAAEPPSPEAPSRFFKEAYPSAPAEPEAEQRRHEPLAEDVAHFADDTMVEPVAAEPIIEEAFPSAPEDSYPPILAEVEAEERKDEPLEEVALDYFDDDTVVEPIAVAPMEPIIEEAPPSSLEQTYAPPSAEVELDESQYELLEETAVDFFESEAAPEPAAAEPTIAGVYPPTPADVELYEESQGELLEEEAVGFFEDVAWAQPVATEPMMAEVSQDRMETMDETISDATEQPDALPRQSTDHPLYQEVESFINQGAWSAARAPLEELMTLYPDDAYLKEISTSVRARSALLDSALEIAPARRSILSRGLRYIVPVVAVIALLGLVTVVVLALQLWILPQQAERQRAQNISQIRQDAQAALVSGDYDRAIIAYTEILDLLPGDPEAEVGLEQAGQLRATVSRYTEAIAEMEAHRWDNALSILQQIQVEQPNYRNVPELIASIQEQQDLSDRFAEAEAAFDRGYYELAAQEYEELQSLDYGFERETVQEHLFLSYLQLGLAEEEAAGSDPQGLQAALEKLEKALALRPEDSQTKGESQLLRFYLASLDEFETGNWPQTIADLTPVYEARPGFAEGTAAERLYEAKVAWGDDLMAEEQFEQALAMYQEAHLITEVDTAGLDPKIASARRMLATPTPTPEPTQAAEPTAASTRSGSGAGPAPTATPKPLPYALKGMSVRSNCSGFGYIHGIIWSTYNFPMAGISVQAFNTTTGLGPLVSLPTNDDGIYQIILQQDQIEGLWVVQVLENGQPVSQAWGQRLGGGCVNGAQELKVDWQRTSELQ